MHFTKFMFNCNPRIRVLDDGFDDIFRSCTLNEIDSEENITNLFGLQIKLDKISVNTIHHLFATLRKYSDYLRNTALTTNEFIPTTQNGGLKLDWLVLRQEIISTLSLFKYLLNHNSSTCTTEIKKTILNELKSLLLSINRISHLPELIFYELFSPSSSKQGSTSQLFHLHLDIWCNIYQILKHVDPLLKEDLCLIRDKNFPTGDLMNQLRNILLSDLISISLIKFDINHSDNYRHLDNAFSCSCIKLIYVFIYLESNDGIEFWNDFNKIIDEFAKSHEQQVESIRNFQWINKSVDRKFNELASLWLISSLSELFQQVEQIDEKQFKYQDNSVFACSVVKSLMRNFDENQIEINVITTILKLCLKLTKNLNIEIVLVFFDFFMKNLNTPFQLNNNMKNMQMLPKSGHIWHQKLIGLNNVEVNSEENVNQLFYYLIYKFVKRSSDDKSASNHFQKFKGRLYSKLQAKKIEEFKDIGLYNLLNTFIVTSYASDKSSIIDLLNKFLFVIKVIKNKGLYNSRMMLVLRSLFCFNYFVSNNQDLTRLNEIIVELFNEICESTPAWTLSNIQVSTVHNAYFELINVYCNELLDYLKHHESPNQAFGNLFKCKFSCLLPKLSEREVLSILQFINNLIDEIKLKIENDDGNLSFYTSIYELINEQFIDFLKVQMRTTINPQIPNVIYKFIYMTNLLSTNEQKFKSLIENFLFNKSSNMFNLCELIVKIVDPDAMIFSRFLDVYYGCNLDRKLMEIWFQLAITIQLPNEQFEKLTNQLSIQFPVFKSSNNGLLAIQDVFSNIYKKYQLSSSSQDKARLSSELNQCLSEMVNQGKNILKDDNANEETLNQLYTILSYLVLNCCHMIHIQGNNSSILPQLLETFFNPNYIQNLATLKVQNINNCLRKTLPKVLNGLASLRHKSNDPYIDRKVKILFVTYVPLFLIKNSTHPILIELSQSRSTDLFHTILHYVKDCLFVRPPVPSNPALTIQLVQFTNEFYSSVRNVEQRNQLFKLFPLFLDKMMASEELTKRKIRNLLTLMVDNEVEKSNLIEFYEEFIKKNGSNLVRVIKVLEFTLPFCLLIRGKLISILMHRIKQIEDSSSGVDDLLRVCFQQFINKISN